jgi:hypothetical protein
MSEAQDLLLQHVVTRLYSTGAAGIAGASVTGIKAIDIWSCHALGDIIEAALTHCVSLGHKGSWYCC